MIYSLEIEKQVLAAFIQKPKLLVNFNHLISEADFHNGSLLHKTLFAVLKKACQQEESIDEVVLVQRVKDLGIKFEENLSLIDYVKSLSMRKIHSEEKIKSVVQELKKYSVRREIYKTAKDIADSMKTMSPNESYLGIIESADKIYNDKVNLFEVGNDVPENIYDSMQEFIEERGNNPIEEFGMMGPHEKVNDIYGSLLRPGNITVFVARSGVGKMNPLYTKVLTPDGFTEMRNISEGSEVVCPNGKISKVLKTFDHKNKDVYRVTFEDGRYSDCGLEHLWKVSYKNKSFNSRWTVSDTEQIKNVLNGGHKAYIPLVPKIKNYEEKLKKLKFFIKERTESSQEGSNSLNYLTKTKILAEKVQKFAWALGAKAKISSLKISDVDMFKVEIEIPDFRNENSTKLQIVDIQKLEKKEDCRCIQIDEKEHLYIIDEFIVTHNTQLCMDYSTKVSAKYDVPVLHFDNGEMSKDELIIRQCAAISGVPPYLLESGKWRQAGDETVQKVRSVWKKVKNLKFYYYNVGGMEVDSMINTLKRFYYSKVGRGNKMIFSFDYIKTSSDRGFGNKNEWQLVGEMVDKFKKCIQKEILEDGAPVIPMITSVQSNRSGITTNRNSSNIIDDESVVSLSDRITQFCSHMFILRQKTNDEIAEEGSQFGTHKLINVKSRHLGKDVAGAVEPVQVGDDLRKNFINLSFRNFNITECGDLRDIVHFRNSSEDLSTDSVDNVPSFDDL